MKELILPTLSTDAAYLGLSQRLRYHVENLSLHVGRRNAFNYRSLAEAAELITATFEGLGFTVRRQRIRVLGFTFSNLEVRVEGSDPDLAPLIVGAHYDAGRNSPGANANATGVAALLELARALRRKTPRRPIRLIAFANGKFPFANTPWMGSRVYARMLRKERTRIHGMISLDTLSGSPIHEAEVFDETPESIDYLALVGNEKSKDLLSELRNRFTVGSPGLPVQPFIIPRAKGGVWSSDHWSFWNEGFSAVLFTGTPPLRYHLDAPDSDTPDRIDYPWLAAVTEGLVSVARST